MSFKVVCICFKGEVNIHAFTGHILKECHAILEQTLRSCTQEIKWYPEKALGKHWSGKGGWQDLSLQWKTIFLSGHCLPCTMNQGLHGCSHLRLWESSFVFPHFLSNLTLKIISSQNSSDQNGVWSGGHGDNQAKVWSGHWVELYIWGRGWLWCGVGESRFSR